VLPERKSQNPLPSNDGECYAHRSSEKNQTVKTKDQLLRRGLSFVPQNESFVLQDKRNRLRQRGGASRLFFFVAAESRDPLTPRLRSKTFTCDEKCGTTKSKSAPLRTKGAAPANS
jgi:hypothetical protein